MIYTPGSRVLVSHPHPRTGARGLLAAHVERTLASGRVVVHLTVDRRWFRIVTDSVNVRAAP